MLNFLNIFDDFKTKRRHLVMDEKEVIKVISTLNGHKIFTVTVGNCGWGDDSKKWFINFDVSNKKWNLIIKELKVIRVWSEKDIPTDGVGAVYSTD